MFSLGGWKKGRGGCVRNIGHEHDFCQAQKAENTDSRANYAVKYATARGQKGCAKKREHKHCCFGSRHFLPVQLGLSEIFTI